MKDFYGNVVELTPTPAQCRQIISDTLDHLESIDYREGFNDSVLSKLCDSVNEQFPNMRWVMWSDCCMVEYSYSKNPSSSQVQLVVEKYLDNDWKLMERWVAIEKVASGEGSFVMPEWGTYGT